MTIYHVFMLYNMIYYNSQGGILYCFIVCYMALISCYVTSLKAFKKTICQKCYMPAMSYGTLCGFCY